MRMDSVWGNDINSAQDGVCWMLEGREGIFKVSLDSVATLWAWEKSTLCPVKMFILKGRCK